MSNEIADANNDSQSRRFSPIAVCFVLIILYPFSVGPVVWFATKVLKVSPSGFVDQMLEAFYSPLRWLYENSTLARTVLDSYVGLFGM